MRFSHAVGLGCVFKLGYCKLADRLQHCEPWFTVNLIGLANQVLVEEGRRRLEHIEGAVEIRYLVRGIKRPPPGKDPEAAKERLLLRGEQVVTPGNRVTEGSLPCRGIPRTTGEYRQTALEPSKQRCRRENLDPGCGQLN